MLRHVRTLRRDQTDAERLLWSRLRRRQVAGVKFRRQHQVGWYICDFASVDRRLIVELEGSHHLDQVAYDERRKRFLRSAGFRVLRFWNGDVLARPQEVVETIFRALETPMTPPPP
jgi:very-short-patch-repair endonuclease